MSYCRQVTASLFRPAIVPAILFSALFSCRVPKDFQPGKPFVFRTNIRVEGKMKNDQRQDLAGRLQNQLDDSLQTKTITAFDWPWHGHMIYKKLSHPPVYDSLNLGRSVTFMTALLNANGYYSPGIRDTVRIKTVHKGKIYKGPFRSKKIRGASKEEQRVTINFLVKPGKQLIFDSVGFDLSTPELQQLTLESRSQSLIKKGSPYTRQVLVSEINRLVDTFRNHGYYRFSKEDLYVEHDTVFAALIDPSLDPLEQAELLEKLRKKNENPTINVTVKQRAVQDSTHMMKYYIGRVTVYPDLPVIEDTVPARTDTTTLRNMQFISRTDKFRLSFLADNIFLRPGRLYKQDNYYRTSNRLSRFSAWQYNNIDFQNSLAADSLLDVTLRLYPAKKQNLTVDLEASRNTNDIVSTSDLFGTGLNFGLQNRNAYRQSIQTNTNLRGGVEFGSGFIQSTLLSFSHTISIPRIIAPIPIRREGRLRLAQTVINLNASYTDRSAFFKLRSINGSFGYQWSRSRQHNADELSVSSTRTFLWKPLNVEYTGLHTTDSLDRLLIANPSLKLAFRPGLVIGQQFIYNSVRTKANRTNYLLATLEESGAVLGFIRPLDEGQLFRFIKGELEFRHNIDYGNGKNQLAFRVYGGAGLSYGRSGNGYEQTLPFFKAFFAGGPNSMRAWQVRQLGLGSSKFYSDTPYNNVDLRFGDIKLEGNIEYRFLLGTLFGIKFRSALYTDIGNIWNWKPIDTSELAKGSDFRLNRFYKEFAIGAGTGLRMDFNYFLIRLDWAYKIRDPQRIEDPGKWFYKLTPGSGQLQLGINYPF
jgi:outer membrane protein assembly factor BamA